MKQADPIEATVREALAEAARWRLLGLLFERPRHGWTGELAGLARELDDPGLVSAARAAREASEGAYLAFLGPGGISPREVSYRGMEDPARVLASLSAWYEAFAYRPRAEDPIDHVAVEAGFAGYLALKEAAALAGGKPQAAEVAAEGRRRFVETHLRSLAGPLTRRLRAASAPTWLLQAAQSLVARTGDAPDATVPLPGDDDGAGFDCAATCPS